MAAGLGFKTFTTGEVLTAGDVNGYLMQGILVFASAAARDAAITSPQEGQACYLKDTNATQTYSGSAWVAVGGSGSPLTTKGDLYTYSTTDARLGVGTNGQVLQADSAEATGLKWVTASASTATIAQIATGTLSGATVTISSLSTYDQLFIQFRNVDMSSITGFSLLVNNNTGAANYNWNGFNLSPTTSSGATQKITRAGFMPYYQGNLPSSGQDNDSGFTLTNCKAAGFTNASWVSGYQNSNAAFQAEAAQGQYLVAEAVSSLVFSANAGTFDGGTYTIWGG
jgi:hypothetical protein